MFKAVLQQNVIFQQTRVMNVKIAGYSHNSYTGLSCLLTALLTMSVILRY